MFRIRTGTVFVSYGSGSSIFFVLIVPEYLYLLNTTAELLQKIVVSCLEKTISWFDAKRSHIKNKSSNLLMLLYGVKKYYFFFNCRTFPGYGSKRPLNESETENTGRYLAVFKSAGGVGVIQYRYRNKKISLGDLSLSGAAVFFNRERSNFLSLTSQIRILLGWKFEQFIQAS